MADKKVSELSAITNLSGDDLLLVVNDPSGTPTSNKVTVSNLFANIVPNVVHKGTVTTRANTTFTGTTMTVSSNATFSGTLTVSGTLVEGGVSQRSGIQIFDANTIHNDTLFANGGLVISSSVSSGASNIIGKNGNLNANNAIADNSITADMIEPEYMEVANTNLLVNDRMQVANVNTLVSDRLQVANASVYIEVTNAVSQFANSFNSLLTGATQANLFSAELVNVNNSLGFTLTKSTDPSTSNALTEGVTSGTVFYSNTYLYIATDENTIKRITLESF